MASSDASFDPASLALRHVHALHAYTPGEQPAESGWVKLNTNENPFPPSPMVIEAIQRELTDHGDRLRLYPSPRASLLRETIAHYHGLASPDQVLAGNGSDDVLNLLVRAFCADTQPAGMTFPSYSLYPVLTGIQNGRLITLPFDRSMSLDPAAIIRSGASLFFLTSPNAPTGVAFLPETLRKVLEGFKGLLVVDEAYAPFAKYNAVALLRDYPNLVITRTLSKAYSLAGLRVGYALADPRVISLLDRVRDSYNLDRLAQAGAIAALRDEGYTQAIIGKIKRIRDYYQAAFTQRGWFTYPSQANFLFTEPCDRDGQTGPAVAASLFAHLKSKRILIRYFPSHPLTSSFLRISIGSEPEMETLTDAIDSWNENA